MRNPIHISIVIALVFAGLIGATGCGDRSAETPTRGKVAFTVSEELLPLMREAEKQYEELYPEALIELRPRHDREAITDLFNDSVKLIVTARPLNGEERAVQKKFKIEVNEFRIALDAVVFIVNTANDVSRLTIPQADSIFTGAVMDWGLLGWRGAPGKMTLYLPDKNAAAYEVVAGFLPPGKVFVTPGKICSTSRELIDAVAADPTGIGIVGLNWMRENSSPVKTLELSDPAAPESLGIAGKYFSPHQAYIYKGYYPVVRDVYIYSTPDSYGVSTGFTSFMTSAAGQKIVQNQGLVPATMPVRLVQLRNDEL
jgi:phosphate transport system substrate-binding protein